MTTACKHPKQYCQLFALIFKNDKSYLDSYL